MAQRIARCGFFKLISAWPDSGWLVTPSGLYGSLVALTRDFRNRAAHLDTLTQIDSYCREFVLGGDGILWRLLAATHGRESDGSRPPP